MTGFQWPAAWPRPADTQAAASLAADLDTALAALPAGTALQTSEARAAIACLGGNSPYLADLARRDVASLPGLLAGGPADAVSAAMRRLRALKPDMPRQAIRAGLRDAKRQVALAVALADLGGIWTLEQVTGALSLLAETALRVSVSHLLWHAQEAGVLRRHHRTAPERGSGFIVLAMGKLGARELNYSSDIDIVLLYDPARQDGMDGLSRTFTRLTADLVSLMEARDADGYVFRTDLRLRPDPEATPPCVGLPAALAYYEAYGQTWERAAMSKARPVAGDLEAGAQFLEQIRPFIWRRHLDFAAIQDIHAMKRRIDRQKGGRRTGFGSSPEPGAGDDPLLGRDLKLGAGGIREIEFVAQTLQLVWGGREPDLRDPTTLGALRRLAQRRLLGRDTARQLREAYRLLRQTEHRLQMQADRQTHALPPTQEGLERFALFMGEPDAAALRARLLPVLERTHAQFGAFFVPQVGQEPEILVQEGTLDLDDPDLSDRLLALGFPPSPQAVQILGGWHGERYRALRSERARALLHDLAPELLRTLARQRDPLAALVRFDTLLSRQRAGVQLLSLFAHNPALLARIAAILGAAPSLADHLAAVPSALDGLLIEDGEEVPAEIARRQRQILDLQMRRSGDLEDAIRAARALVRGEEFRLSVAQMEGRLDVDAAGLARTALAETVITRMLAIVQREHQARFGRIPGGGLAVVMLGKAGSREMMSGSDLDLMLIYDHATDASDSVARGTARNLARSLAPSQYFTRLAHALIAALSAPGVEGPLYPLDMRLRPSGSKGPVAVSLASFRRYHAEQAWTWERMALTRARVVAGPPSLRRQVAHAIAEALDMQARLPDGAAGLPAAGRLLEDAAAMRARVARDLPPHGIWDVKLTPGGLMEVEFIAQIRQLVALTPRARHPTTRIALRRLARAGAIGRADAATLIAADRFWRSVQSSLRILLGVQAPSEPQERWPTGIVEALLRGAGLQSGSARRPEAGGATRELKRLEALREETAAAVRGAFLRLVGPLPAGGPAGIGSADETHSAA